MAPSCDSPPHLVLVLGDIARRFKIIAGRAGLPEVMQAGRWKRPTMRARYAERLMAGRGPWRSIMAGGSEDHERRPSALAILTQKLGSGGFRGCAFITGFATLLFMADGLQIVLV